MNSVVKSQFIYCALMWVFCSRNVNNSLNYTYNTTICLVHDKYNSSFSEILEMIKKDILLPPRFYYFCILDIRKNTSVLAKKMGIGVNRYGGEQKAILRPKKDMCLNTRCLDPDLCSCMGLNPKWS